MSQHSMSLRWLCGSALGAIALVAALALPATAGAEGIAHRSGPHGHRVHFSLSGLVQSDSHGALGVYVDKGRIGSRRIQKVLEHVVVQRHSAKTTKRAKRRPSHKASVRLLSAGYAQKANHRAKRSIVVGDVVHLSGMALESGNSQTLDANQEQVVDTHAAAILGTVSSFSVTATSSTLVVTPQTFVTGSEGEGEHGTLTIDASQATVTIDGATAQLADLVSGETVVVVGEKYDGSMMAATILAYSTTPSIAWGHLSSVNGSTLTVHNSSGPETVDASAAAIYLNGVVGATVGQLSQGSFVLALGTAGSSPLAASVVLDFNRGDNSPTGQNEDQGNGHNQAATVFGVVQSVSGSTLAIARQTQSSSQGGGEGDNNVGIRPADDGGGAVNVSAGSAAVTLDGATSSLASLVPGDTVMVIGSTTEDQFTATAVYAYDNAPSVLPGLAESLTATGFSLVGQDGAATPVDASTAAIYLDGSPSTIGALTSDDFVVVFGTTSSSGITASSVFAFNGGQDS